MANFNQEALYRLTTPDAITALGAKPSSFRAPLGAAPTMPVQNALAAYNVPTAPASIATPNGTGYAPPNPMAALSGGLNAMYQKGRAMMGHPAAGETRARAVDTANALRELIVKTESGGDYTAQNPTTTASGKYQYVDGTWGGYGGYGKAKFAPPHIQDAKFNEDLAKRMAKYNGNPFQVIAAHYLPAIADNPELWTSPYTVKTKNGPQTVKSVESYVRQVVKGTPFEAQFNEYIKQHTR